MGRAGQIRADHAGAVRSTDGAIPMTPDAFKSATRFLTLDGKRLNDAELAIAFNRSRRVIRHYKEGTSPITRAVSDHLAYILRHGLLPEVAKAIRERQAKDKRKKDN